MKTDALIRLWNITQIHQGTSGARAAVGVLLGLYNGSRFPFDLTDLRLLDDENLRAALDVITSDASRCQMEVHEWLNRLTGRHDFGSRFERLAYDYRKKGRCKREFLSEVSPLTLRISLEPRTAKSAEECAA
ncbi:DUF7673 family protein [Variovorax sp. DAIF25]|uniref:DUF7673 family protein n=1 Tax=Variovorax sp. DAIF25 TaxID=3080983 RepID=UPI003D6A16E8